MQEGKDIITYLLGIIGTLLLCGGGLVAYIFNRHVSDNDREFEKNESAHTTIYLQLRDKADKRRG